MPLKDFEALPRLDAFMVALLEVAMEIDLGLLALIELFHLVDGRARTDVHQRARVAFQRQMSVLLGVGAPFVRSTENAGDVFHGASGG